MANAFKEKLAALRRQYKEIPIPSIDGESEEIVYYRRPTEMEDEALQKDMKAEFESIKETLRTADEGKKSVYDELRWHFLEGRNEAINYLVLERLPSIRKAAMAEAGLEELDKDATDEQKKEWEEKIKEPFERLREEAKDEWKDFPDEVLASRAAESRIDYLAQEQSWAVYRRSLVSQSLFGKDEDEGFVRIFDDADDVAKFLDPDTINMLAVKIADEIKKHKNVPLK